MQVPLRNPRIDVTGDALQPVQRNTGVGEPGQSGVPEIVPPEMLEPERGDDLVPLRRVAQDTCSDPSTARAYEHPSAKEGGPEFIVGGSSVFPLDAGASVVDSPEDERANFGDNRNRPVPSALGAFVHEPARPWCRLPT